MYCLSMVHHVLKIRINALTCILRKDFMTYLSAPNASVVSLFMMVLLGNKIKLEENSLIIQLLMCCQISVQCLNLEWEV